MAVGKGLFEHGIENDTYFRDNLFCMIDLEIAEFITEQKVATVCTSNNDVPYCFNCYYVFMEAEGILVYKSSTTTKHDKMLVENERVAGTIIPESISVATIRGVQFEGVLLRDSLEMGMKLSASYYLKFPFSMAIPGKLFGIQLNQLKFTDNTRGFGFKQTWERPD
jgi:uncharacterized protein YhbP (UPF0306 family)